VTTQEESKPSFVQLLPTLVAETRSRRLSLVVVFATIALMLLVVGLVWPKRYESSSTILVQEDNIIRPLMEGRAVATSVADRARIAREVIFSRKIVAAIVEEGGWPVADLSAVEQERLTEQIKARATVTSPGQNLIRIGYRDSDPERALRVARRFADLFIAESLSTKERESREAYEFIATRVDEYHNKLTDAEQRLKQFRSENLEARPGTEADVRVRVAELRNRIERAQTDYSELQMREGSLADQLSGEAESSASQGRDAQNRARLAELQVELDTLRLSYTDAYPDVIRVRHQMDDLQREIVAAAQRREQAKAGGAPLPNSETVVANPLYLQLRSDLAKIRGDMAALSARIRENEALLENELERGRRVADSEAALAELTRDYEVNRDIYQDLLKRRENARVSMSLDAEHRGLTFRIQEPAALPLQPSGIRFMHFAAAGLFLGASAPLGLLFLMLRVDPRIRTPVALAQGLAVPVLVTIPEYASGSAGRHQRWKAGMGFALMMAVLLAYGIFGWMRYKHLI
jgi:polysaccharide chain length determinant protein (PEP-CTERM system associated)